MRNETKKAGKGIVAFISNWFNGITNSISASTKKDVLKYEVFNLKEGLINNEEALRKAKATNIVDTKYAKEELERLGKEKELLKAKKDMSNEDKADKFETIFFEIKDKEAQLAQLEVEANKLEIAIANRKKDSKKVKRLEAKQKELEITSRANEITKDIVDSTNNAEELIGELTRESEIASTEAELTEKEYKAGDLIKEKKEEDLKSECKAAYEEFLKS